MSERTAACAWVIYSPNESALRDGAGFWNDTLDWVELGQATRFSTEQACSVALPPATGHDARFVALREVGHYYG
ncbi:hypothetical protein [Pseudomonas sp. FME51]|uniref:hypothetical protein n=1 Tax=Pseudomonas sp. FME51 TaxID=2742609 RepID=UPI0018663C1C|nr:hypothetical protein [Pseudomonas sp. FME51]